jgi:Uma2 family endonuclease
LKKKFKAYEKYGVKEYWIIDPEEVSIEVYESVDG